MSETPKNPKVEFCRETSELPHAVAVRWNMEHELAYQQKRTADALESIAGSLEVISRTVIGGRIHIDSRNSKY